MIAMALVNNPSVLIADEPTTALDVTVQAQILELIDQVRVEFDIGVILITHDLGVVAETADTVLVMYAGRALEHGPAQRDLRRAPAPVHVGASLLDADDRAPARDARADRGLSALADRAAERLPVPSALQLRRCPSATGPCPSCATLPGGHADRCILTPEAKSSGWADRDAVRLGVAG